MIVKLISVIFIKKNKTVIVYDALQTVSELSLRVIQHHTRRLPYTPTMLLQF